MHTDHRATIAQDRQTAYLAGARRARLVRDARSATPPRPSGPSLVPSRRWVLGWRRFGVVVAG